MDDSKELPNHSMGSNMSVCLRVPGLLPKSHKAGSCTHSGLHRSRVPMVPSVAYMGREQLPIGPSMDTLTLSVAYGTSYQECSESGNGNPCSKDTQRCSRAPGAASPHVDMHLS